MDTYQEWPRNHKPQQPNWDIPPHETKRMKYNLDMSLDKNNSFANTKMENIYLPPIQNHCASSCTRCRQITFQLILLWNQATAFFEKTKFILPIIIFRGNNFIARWRSICFIVGISDELSGLINIGSFPVIFLTILEFKTWIKNYTKVEEILDSRSLTFFWSI